MYDNSKRNNLLFLSIWIWTRNLVSLLAILVWTLQSNVIFICPLFPPFTSFSSWNAFRKLWNYWGNFKLCIRPDINIILVCQEGQTPLDLATADDVKCLLNDAMPSDVAIPTLSSSPTPPSGPRPNISLRQGRTSIYSSEKKLYLFVLVDVFISSWELFVFF